MAAPSTQRAALWGDQTLTDMNVEVVSHGAEPGGLPLATIPVHYMVLAEASEVFKQHVIRLRQQELQGAQAHPPAASSRTRKRKQQGTAEQPTGQQYVPHGLKVYRLTLQPDEPQSVPEAVLRNVYTGTLPDDPEQLIWVLWRADYLDIAATVTASVTKLQSLAHSKQLTLQHAVQLHSLPPLQTMAAQHTDSAAALTATVSRVLKAQLPEAAGILTDSALLAQFTQLPLPLVKQWVQLPSLVIDSGNTLAVLFTAWYDAQPTPPTEEQCQVLSALLPIASLSLCFHLQVMPQLKWWRDVTGSGELVSSMMLRVMHELNPGLAGLQAEWERCAGEGRLRLSPEEVSTWACTADEVKVLWHKKTVCLAQTYALGYVWEPCLYFSNDDDSEEGRELRFRCRMSLQPQLLAHGVQHRADSRLCANMDVAWIVSRAAGGGPAVSTSTGFVSDMAGHDVWDRRYRSLTELHEDWSDAKVFARFVVRPPPSTHSL